MLLAVPIYIEDAAASSDKLFHQWELWPGYDDWAAANNRASPLLRAAAADPAYQVTGARRKRVGGRVLRERGHGIPHWWCGHVTESRLLNRPVSGSG